MKSRQTGKYISLFILVLSLCAFAGSATRSADRPLEGTDYSSFDGVLIDSVVIDNRNVYNTDEESYSHFIFKLANKLHITTRKYIIERELLLGEGDPYSAVLAEESARNIRNGLNVYDAWIEPVTLPDGSLLLRVVTVDQWSFSGGVNYSREGNETRWQIGVEEKNFLGNNQFLSLYYYSQSDDDDYVESKFFENRLLGKPYQVGLTFSNNPVAEVQSLSFGRPFYDLGQHTAFSGVLSAYSGRRDVYNDSIRIGESYVDGDQFDASYAYRLGDHSRKLRLQVNYQYRYERNSEQTIFSTAPEDSLLARSNFADDSLFHYVGLEAKASKFDYVKMRKIDGFAYTEDFIVGYFAQAEYGRAFNSDFKLHQYDLARFMISRYTADGSNLLRLDYVHYLWFYTDKQLRHMAQFIGRYYRRVNGVVTLALNVSYLSDWDASGRNNLILGGNTGIRGYDKYFKTGNRRAVLNVESRFFTNIKILSALFGAVAFADFGNVWKDDEEISLKGMHSSVGVGLRIGFEKSTKNIVRIDLAFSDQNQWELSIGTHQYFQAQSTFW
ncbi:MAG: hypothetical protein AB1483_10765 [Candidatus Zixiibacteriota bacterium]